MAPIRFKLLTFNYKENIHQASVVLFSSSDPERNEFIGDNENEGYVIAIVLKRCTNVCDFASMITL